MAVPTRLACALAAAGALLGAAAPLPAAGEDPRALQRENRRLAAELELARTPKSYFVLDLDARRVSVRARGMTLVEWPVEKALLWGRRPPPGTTALAKRDALPRPAIKPGEEQTVAGLDERILEVADMPVSYRLALEGDVDVRVVPAAGSSLRERLVGLAMAWKWRLARPLRSLLDRRRGRESTSILLVLGADDARALYWSLYEGIPGVVVPPE